MKNIKIYAFFCIILSFPIMASQKDSLHKNIQHMSGLFSIDFSYEIKNVTEDSWSEVDLGDQSHAMEYIVAKECKDQVILIHILQLPSKDEQRNFMLHFIQQFLWKEKISSRVKMQVLGPNFERRYLAGGIFSREESILWKQKDYFVKAEKPVRDKNDETYDTLFRNHTYEKTAEGFIDVQSNRKKLETKLVAIEKGRHVYNRLDNADIIEEAQDWFDKNVGTTVEDQLCSN